MYPSDWPRCRCGEPVLDGHLTCGEAKCDERGERDRASSSVPPSDRPEVDFAAMTVGDLAELIAFEGFELRLVAVDHRWTCVLGRSHGPSGYESSTGTADTPGGALQVAFTRAYRAGMFCRTCELCGEAGLALACMRCGYPGGPEQPTGLPTYPDGMRRLLEALRPRRGH